MISFRLAFRNILGAGLRTWLNVIVLSFSFVVIIWNRGILDGWNRQARLDMINWEIGGGQYWHHEYDPYDPFTLTDAHGGIPKMMDEKVGKGEIAPVLITQATIYPEGRIQSVLLKGIDPKQSVLDLPARLLSWKGEEIPAIIGTRTAKNNRLKTGDQVTVRWRDKDGTFDAAEIKIVGVFKTNVPTVDNAQVWIPLERLRHMTLMHGEATLLVANKENPLKVGLPGWNLKTEDDLLADIDLIIKQKSFGAFILYALMMSLAMLAIFDTQVLSIFRRRKEIGTYIALGMTRGQVVRLFTLEGATYGILAAATAALYGIPLLWMQAKAGFKMPQATDDYGLALAEKIFPVYSVQLVLGTIILVFLTTTIVSFLPARKIADLNPTDALKGKWQ